MAWRNTMRFKKRFFISASCLSLGLIFPDELLGRIQNLPGIESSSVVRGCFAEVLVEEEALELRKEDLDLDMDGRRERLSPDR